MRHTWVSAAIILGLAATWLSIGPMSSAQHGARSHVATELVGYPPPLPQPYRPPPVVTIGVYDNYFLPASMNVAPGTLVRWDNLGRHHHTVTFPGGSDSGELPPGIPYALTFPRPGVYHYYCRFHGVQMRGMIVVGF